MEITGHGETALFVGGVDHAVEGFSSVLTNGQGADVVELCRTRHRSTYADIATMPMWGAARMGTASFKSA